MDDIAPDLLEKIKNEFQQRMKEDELLKNLKKKLQAGAAVHEDAYEYANRVGEILAAAEFYDFDAKYNNAESRTVIGPELPGDSAERVREAAAKIFNAVDGYGLSRVDFFVTSDGEVIFNEINTMPGFTAISMYPMLWEAAGISKPELVDRLIDLAFER